MTSHPSFEPVLVRDLIAEGRDLEVHCRGCGKHAEMDPNHLLTPPWKLRDVSKVALRKWINTRLDTPLRQLRGFRCNQCGSAECEARASQF